MKTFLRAMRIWSKISIIGIGCILLIIACFMVADQIFNLDYGYKSDDLYIVALIAVCSIFLYLLVQRLALWVKDR